MSNATEKLPEIVNSVKPKNQSIVESHKKATSKHPYWRNKAGFLYIKSYRHKYRISKYSKTGYYDTERTSLNHTRRGLKKAGARMEANPEPYKKPCKTLQKERKH